MTDASPMCLTSQQGEDVAPLTNEEILQFKEFANMVRGRVAIAPRI